MNKDTSNDSLEYFENLRLSSTDVERVNNFDFIRSNDNEHFSTLGFCHIPIFVPTQQKSESRGALGALLAMQHLNNGDGSVVSEVDGLDKRCNIRFTGEIFDTETSGM